MAYTRTDYYKELNAALTVQKLWRGYLVRIKLPTIRKYQVKNLNAGHHLSIEEINAIGFWADPVSASHLSRMKLSDLKKRARISGISEDQLDEADDAEDRKSAVIVLLQRQFADREFHPSEESLPSITDFSETIDCLYEGGNRGQDGTDFIERGNRPLCKALELVEASLSNKPIHDIFTGEEIVSPESVDTIIKDIIDTLGRGDVYRFCNWTSAKLQPSALGKVKTAHAKFRYFTNLDTPKPKKASELTLEERINELLRMPVEKCTTTPRLVRQAPISPYCCVKTPIQQVQPMDDLERRYQKLLGL
jgi:hypothetical protein